MLSQMCSMEKIKTEREREREGERERAFFLKIALDRPSIFKHVIKHVISVFLLALKKCWLSLHHFTGEKSYSYS